MAFPDFDAEGSGYDYESAQAAGLRPGPDGHWPSRDPRTGLLLKGKTHETWGELEKGEEKANHEIYRKDGRYYSRPRLGMSLDKRLGLGNEDEAPAPKIGMTLEERLQGGKALHKSTLRQEAGYVADSVAEAARKGVGKVLPGFVESFNKKQRDVAGDVAGTAGLVTDMAWDFAVGQWATHGIMAPAATAYYKIFENDPKAYEKGSEFASKTLENIPWSSPAKKVFKMLKSGEAYDDSPGSKAMERFSQELKDADKAAQDTYGSAPGAFTQFVEQLMAVGPLAPRGMKTTAQAAKLREYVREAKGTYSQFDRSDFIVGDVPGVPGQQVAPMSPYRQQQSLRVLEERARAERESQQAAAAETQRLERQRYGGVPTGTAVIPFSPDIPLNARLEQLPPAAPQPPAPVSAAKPRIRPKSQRGAISSPEEMAAGYTDADLKAMGLTREELVNTLREDRPWEAGKIFGVSAGVGALGATAVYVYNKLTQEPEEPKLDEENYNPDTGNPLARDLMRDLPYMGAIFYPIRKGSARDLRARHLEKGGKDPRFIWSDSQVIKGGDNRYYAEISDHNLGTTNAMNKREGGVIAPGQGRLSDFFQHPELFDAEPRLADRRVSEITDQGDYATARYLPGLEQFQFRGQRPQDLMDSFVHEVTHYMGDQEGASHGSTIGHYMEEGKLQDYQRILNDFNRLVKENPALRGLSYYAIKDAIDARTAGKATSKQLAYLKVHESHPKFKDFLDIAGRGEALMPEVQAAMDKYQADVGEVFARLGETRRKMTPEERRANFPVFDVPVERQTTRPGKMGPADSVKDVTAKGEQQGFISPELMNTLAGGSLGAVAGMAFADPEDKWVGAGIGAALGLGLASRAGKSIGRKSEIYKAAEKSFAGVIDDFWRKFNPDQLGPKAEGASAVLSMHYVDMLRRHITEGVEGDQRLAFFKGLSDTELQQFRRGLEMGVTFKNPEWQRYATDYRKMALEILQRDAALNIKYDPLDHYVFHIFKEPGAAQAFLANRYGKGWDVDINKKAARYITDLENAGFELRYTNPEDIMRARVHASDIAKLKVDSLKQLADFGLAREKKRGDFIQAGETEWTAPNGKSYYLPDHVNQVFDNAFNSRSLWDDTGFAGMSYRGTMWMKNSIVPWKLLSLFHPLHVELGMNSGTAAVNATKAWAAGNMGALEATGKVLAAPLLNVPQAFMRTPFLFRKWQPEAMKAFRGEVDPANITPEMQRQMTLALEGGFSPEMAAEYKNAHVKAFTDAAQRIKQSYGANLAADARFLWEMPFAALEKFWTKPVFENWIPALKWEAYQKSAAAHMAANPDLASRPLDRMIALRKVSKMIDDRFGEMQYKTLFMDRMVKDIMVASFLSYGWQYGFMRSYIGAFPEAAAAFTKDQNLVGRGTLRERIARGELDKTLFLGNYLMATMLYGGLMTYALSGDTPKEILDYIYPRTGEKNPDGTQARVSTPYYTREFVSIPKHIEEEGALVGGSKVVANKLSPALGLVNGLITNKDFFNREISDPRADLWTRTLQKMAYVAGELEPISTSAPRRSGKFEPRDYALAAAGFAPAPKYVTESPAEAQIKRYLRYHRPATTPYEKAVRGQEVYQLFRLKQAGNIAEFEAGLDEVRRKYKMTHQEVDRIRKESSTPAVFRQFKILTADEQRDVLKRMEPEDQKRFRPFARKAVQDELGRR